MFTEVFDLQAEGPGLDLRWQTGAIVHSDMASLDPSCVSKESGVPQFRDQKRDGRLLY
jgi:hypothetical protein